MQTARMIKAKPLSVENRLSHNFILLFFSYCNIRQLITELESIQFNIIFSILILTCSETLPHIDY